MKSLKRVLIFILAMLISLPLIWSCGKDTGDTDDEKNDPPCTEHVDEDNNSRCDKCNEALIDPDNDTEPDEVMLIEDGKAKFTFVLKDGSSDLVVSALKKLTDKLDSLDVSTGVVGEDSQATACEVLVGATSCRGDAYEYDMYTLGISHHCSIPVCVLHCGYRRKRQYRIPGTFH